jgi:hypothetical protein
MSFHLHCTVTWTTWTTWTTWITHAVRLVQVVHTVFHCVSTEATMGAPPSQSRERSLADRTRLGPL